MCVSLCVCAFQLKVHWSLRCPSVTLANPFPVRLLSGRAITQQGTNRTFNGTFIQVWRLCGFIVTFEKCYYFFFLLYYLTLLLLSESLKPQSYKHSLQSGYSCRFAVVMVGVGTGNYLSNKPGFCLCGSQASIWQ